MPRSMTVRDLDGVVDASHRDRGRALAGRTITQLPVAVVTPAFDRTGRETSTEVVIPTAELCGIVDATDRVIAVVVATGAAVTHLTMAAIAKAFDLAVGKPGAVTPGLGAHFGDVGQRPGDLFVRVSVEEDPSFIREGDDLVTRLDISMVQAALGGVVLVPTLDGELELELDPGTQPGTVKALQGRGMPSLRGNGRGIVLSGESGRKAAAVDCRGRLTRDNR